MNSRGLKVIVPVMAVCFIFSCLPHLHALRRPPDCPRGSFGCNWCCASATAPGSAFAGSGPGYWRCWMAATGYRFAATSCCWHLSGTHYRPGPLLHCSRPVCWPVGSGPFLPAGLLLLSPLQTLRQKRDGYHQQGRRK